MTPTVYALKGMSVARRLASRHVVVELPSGLYTVRMQVGHGWKARASYIGPRAWLTPLEPRFGELLLRVMGWSECAAATIGLAPCTPADVESGLACITCLGKSPENGDATPEPESR